MNLRNEFNRLELSLINQRAHQLAATTFLLYQQAVLREMAELKRAGGEVTAQAVQDSLPSIADDLAVFEEAQG